MDSSLTKLNPLAATLVAVAVFTTLLLGHIERAEAATVAVTNCNDSGPGSLRDGVAAASSGDTVDLRHLTCERITLISGPIAIPQASLAIRGPGFSRMALSGNFHSSVLRHSGAGTLSLSGLEITQGHLKSDAARGGCIYSEGNADIVGVQVHHCAVYGNSDARGGGIYVEGNLRLFTSAVYSNRAVDGAGLFVFGRLRAHRVRIRANRAEGRYGVGGGFRALNGASISYSTIAGNSAMRFAGGGYVYGIHQDGATLVVNSTFSNNSAGEQVGGLDSGNARGTVIVNSTFSGNVSASFSALKLSLPATVANSTIAFNREEPGLLNCRTAVLAPNEVHLESTIVARNTCDGAPGVDISDYGYGTGSVVGADDLIESAGIPVPADTIHADPKLSPLGEYGGRTLTHALLDGSPAIDRGNNVLGLHNDQRGRGFPRMKDASTDIGAFER